MFAFVQTHKMAVPDFIVWQNKQWESGPERKNPAGGLCWPFGKRSKAGHEGDAPTKIEVVMPRLCLRRNMFVALKRVKQSIAGAPKGAF